ncbi:META domain-containing protein [Streptomyces sp. LP11]|uniref:META domain-containing protein n=1 Tax=Streptomyces pyxinicus TaxID=2970331 RepID=A0ABT2AZA2_9ACTN|nr:META domain-containing protein [Streptomyces sp. LP11]MCS0601570.1 META domain-containing protein [Streptomyces sp. LP11]
MTLAVAAALLPCVVACGGGKADSGAVSERHPVTGIDWRVDSVTVDGTTHDAPATARLRIDADGKASGDLGCNRFSARGTVDGDHVTLGQLRTTRMACAPARMEFERTLARTLTTGTLTAHATETRLTLTDGDGDRVRLSRPAPE